MGTCAFERGSKQFTNLFDFLFSAVALLAGFSNYPLGDFVLSFFLLFVLMIIRNAFADDVALVGREMRGIMIF